MTETQKLLYQASSWTIADDASRIVRTFCFENFKEAIIFVNKIGELFEIEGH